MSDFLPKMGLPESLLRGAAMPQLPTSQVNPAQWTYEKLVDQIKNFESELDEEHEVGARLVSFGASVTFHIEDMGYSGPFMITFYGVNEQGSKVQLHQHFTQLSVLLVAMKKLGEKPRRIGFDLGQGD